MITYIDIHAHLYDYSDDELRDVVNESVEVGVTKIINCATSLDTSYKILEQCKLFPQVLKPVVGISPFDCANTDDSRIEKIERLIDAHPQIVALGEIGLDNTNPTYPPIEAQLPVFKTQLKLALRKNLCVILHSRGMEKEVAEICKSEGVTKAIFHCFTGDTAAMEYIIDSGYYISISGIITYKNSHLREMIKQIPLERLLIETDAPYLAPVPHRGKPNKSPYLIHTAREIFKILNTLNTLNIDETLFAENLENNYITVLQR